jgi:uncharacterized protein YbjT (DUF2867 family)
MHVVTTPTGQIGSQVVANLLAAGEPVRVIVRNPDKLPREIFEEVEVVQGSSDDEKVLMQALEGAESLFLVIPPSFKTTDCFEYTMSFTLPAIKAAKKHAVKRIVSVSGICHDVDFEAGPVTAAYTKDAAIERAGIDHRAVWCPGFMENMLNQVMPLRSQGKFFLPCAPDVKLPLVCTRDIAESGTALLLDRSWSGPGGLAVLGPEDLTWNEVAGILTDLLGKKISYQQISGEDYKAQLVSHGASKEFAQDLLDMFIAKDNGLDAEPRTKENTTRTSFREWAKEELLPAMGMAPVGR